MPPAERCRQREGARAAPAPRGGVRPRPDPPPALDEAQTRRLAQLRTEVTLSAGRLDAPASEGAAGIRVRLVERYPVAGAGSRSAPGAARPAVVIELAT